MAGASAVSLQDIYEDRMSPNRALIEAQRELPSKVADCMAAMEVSDAIGLVVDHLRLVSIVSNAQAEFRLKCEKQANKTITDVAPWKPTTTPAEAYASHISSIETLRVAGICLQLFVPGVAGKLLDALDIPEGERSWTFASPQGSEAVKKATGVRLFE